MRRLYGLYGDQPDPFLLETIEQNRSQLKKVMDRMTNEEEREREIASKKRLAEKMSKVEDIWAAMTEEEKRSLLHEAINTITIEQNTISIDFKL